MRGAFIRTLVRLAYEDDRIFLLTGDLGYTALEPFVSAFPDRFVNVGVAEQNMVGIATGLAEAGYVPFVYSIATFACLRPYEFIRNGPIYHQLPVRIVGVGGGMEYSHNGVTHYGLEDIAVMRSQPAMAVLAPADAQQAVTVLEKTYQLKGPIYYRLGKDDTTLIAGLEGRFEYGDVQTIREGTQILILAAGAATFEAVSAADSLLAKGVSSRVITVPTLNPAPTKALENHLRRFSVVLTVESHYINGGLGSIVAETIAEAGLSCRLMRLGLRDMPDGTTGRQAYLHTKYGIAAQSVMQAAQSLVAPGI